MLMVGGGFARHQKEIESRLFVTNVGNLGFTNVSLFGLANLPFSIQSTMREYACV